MIREFSAVLTALTAEGGVDLGKMFGSQGLRADGKVFAMEVKGRLVVKLSLERASALVAEGLAVPFDPGHGRLMKQWVAVSADSPVDWLELAREARQFGSAQSVQNRPGK